MSMEEKHTMQYASVVRTYVADEARCVMHWEVDWMRLQQLAASSASVQIDTVA